MNTAATTPHADLRVGIDVGGTNTDAVVIDASGAVLKSVKTATTLDPIDGIQAALGSVLQDIDRSQVTKAMLGTTHPANAIIQRKGLDRVGILRLAAPSSLAVRPGAAWPADIRAAVIAHSAIIEGGNEYTGAEIAPLDEDAVKRFGAEAIAAGCNAIAVAGAFSPASAEHELRTFELLLAEVGPEFSISLSHQIGSLGLLERENATILNAALLSVAHRVASGFERALEGHGLTVDSYLTQNDGTLMSAAEASRYPVLTLGSGPTNSMRGACALAGVNDAIVIDVGGTSADVGILVNGFPRESSAAVEVGGVRTNFRMPDLISIGLGGGTIVRGGEPYDADTFRVGPDSVGYAVSTEALCVGGGQFTLSDVSLAAGRLRGFGDPALVEGVDRKAVDAALAWVDEQILVMCDRMKSSRAAVPLLVVGGGAHLVPDSIEGISEVLRPRNHAVANAFGACIAEASGAIDRVYSYDSSSREECLDDARSLAVDAAVRAGCAADSVRITSVVEVPMTYVPGGGCRVLVKAAGPLA
ncbi:MAG: hydantoinase/oxoprolinase family protein [Ilumatobacteraceae bacterium]